VKCTRTNVRLMNSELTGLAASKFYFHFIFAFTKNLHLMQVEAATPDGIHFKNTYKNVRAVMQQFAKSSQKANLSAEVERCIQLWYDWLCESRIGITLQVIPCLIPKIPLPFHAHLLHKDFIALYHKRCIYE